MGTESSLRPLESCSLPSFPMWEIAAPVVLVLTVSRIGGGIGVLLVAWPKVNKNVQVRGRKGQEVATGRRGRQPSIRRRDVQSGLPPAAFSALSFLRVACLAGSGARGRPSRRKPRWSPSVQGLTEAPAAAAPTRRDLCWARPRGHLDPAAPETWPRPARGGEQEPLHRPPPPNGCTTSRARGSRN